MKESLFMEAVEFSFQPGGTTLVDLYVSPLVGHDDNVQGVLLVGENVTDKVGTKQALIQSERLATIGRMSTLVAHEIRNPLSSIGLNTELLEDELQTAKLDKDAEPRKLLRCIGREVERLTEVTEEYLKFARLPKPHLMPENINEILTDLLRFVQEEIRSAGVEVDIRIHPSIPSIRADESQLRQAFLNIIRNSIESMENGGTLGIQTDNLDHGMIITITDTGSGIDEKSLDRIFDPFFSTRDGGTGLGLTLTQQIISEHGGNIRCQSEPGQGTTFEITMPYVIEDKE
jgi:signal transduction histidine kinase